MERSLLKKLLDWKESRYRQPLILKGARQVGKTYLLKEFGRRAFHKYHYFNFEEDVDLNAIFEGNLSVSEILDNLKLDQAEISQKQELIIFDEIQQCPRALSALKYFSENAPEIYICSAGSLIGVTLAEESFPVGKVDYLYLTPLKFSEYLQEVDPWAYEALLTTKECAVDKFKHNRLLEAFNEYTIVGGLPRGVLIAQELRTNKGELYQELSNFHDSMIRTYQSDFAKHAGKVNAMHIARTFSNIPSQLSQNIDGSTKRYIFKGVVPGLRGYANLEGPISWLVNAGLAYKVKILKKGLLPLESFTDENMFKLYLFDSGLLLRMLKIPYEIALSNNYGMQKGFVMENVVLSQLTSSDIDSSYCWQENKAELDFVKIIGNDLVPIEVKSSHKYRSKSLASYIKRYQPKIGVVFSTNNFSFDEARSVLNVPVYYSEFLMGDVDRLSALFSC